jgi:hypothetical protein
MRTRKATVSVVALAMAFGAPAGAQGIGPETRPGMTQPGQTLPGDPSPGTDDLLGTPGTLRSPATPGAPRTSGTAQEPAMQDPAATPGMPPLMPGVPGTAATPGAPPEEPPAAAPGTVGDPLADEPGAGEPPVGTDPQGAPGGDQPPPAAPGSGLPSASDPGGAGEAMPTDPATIEEPVGEDAPAAGPDDGAEPAAAEPPGDGSGEEPGGAGPSGDGGADEPAATDAGGDDDGVGPEAEADPAASSMERITLAEMDGVLREVGADDVQLFFGSIVRASAGEAGRVVMLIGPEDFDPGDGDMTAFGAFDAVLGDLEGAGFGDVHQDIDWYVMQGRLDGHTIFAMEAADMAPDAMRAEAPGEIDGGAVDPDALRDRLGDAGIDVPDDAEPMLFRAELDGSRLFLLVAPVRANSGATELAEDDLRERFEAAGLSAVERVEDVPGLVGAHASGAVVVIGEGELLRDDRG